MAKVDWLVKLIDGITLTGEKLILLHQDFLC